jgi:hypothetical protein
VPRPVLLRLRLHGFHQQQQSTAPSASLHFFSYTNILGYDSAEYYLSVTFSANHGATTSRRVSYIILSLPLRSCSNVLYSTQSRMMLLTHTKKTKKESPLFVHSNLLEGRTIKYEQRFCKGELKTALDNIEDLTIQVGLRSRRALTLWSGWLYGRELWTPANCNDVDDDLWCIMDIYHMCTGLTEEYKFKDYDGMNACLDAIRDILLDKVHLPVDPLGTMGDAFQENSTAINMLAELSTGNVQAMGGLSGGCKMPR